MDNLIDHFAGLAMQAIMQSEHHLETANAITELSKETTIQDAIAMLAYAQAESMHNVRNKAIQEKTAPIIEGATLEGRTLTSLEEHNSTAWITHNSAFSTEPCLNGIACPECGAELMDSNPMVTLASFPAKKNVKCSKCDYTGYRIE